MRPNLIGKNELVLGNHLRSTGRDKKGIHLILVNPSFSIIRPKGRLEIFGSVVGLDYKESSYYAKSGVICI